MAASQGLGGAGRGSISRWWLCCPLRACTPEDGKKDGRTFCGGSYFLLAKNFFFGKKYPLPGSHTTSYLLSVCSSQEWHKSSGPHLSLSRSLSLSHMYCPPQAASYIQQPFPSWGAQVFSERGPLLPEASPLPIPTATSLWERGFLPSQSTPWLTVALPDGCRLLTRFTR